MPRFVILEHDFPVLHWDLMLERGAALWTWRLAETPRPGAVVAAERIADHRPAYLDYEGPVSGGRGEVRRRHAGTFDEPAADGDCVELRLASESFNGVLRLTRVEGDRWRAVFPA